MTRSIPDIPPSAPRVLSVQSHVVHGYVGNKAATFPLQSLNWDVDVLNSVNFSNHTGYGKWEGRPYGVGEVSQLFKGLEAIEMEYNAVLTGYIDGAAVLETVGSKCVEMKRTNPEMLWLLDPVMGDEGQLYVSKDVIPVYREILAKRLVDIVTPNQFELELLLDMPITDLQSLKQAVGLAHRKFGVSYLVVSSLSLSAHDLGIDDDDGKMYSCISSADCSRIILFGFDRYDSYFTGVGDLFSALLLDRVYRTRDIVESTNEVLTIMSKVLYVTREMARGSAVKGKIGDFESMKMCELRIIECMDLYGGTECEYKPLEL